MTNCGIPPHELPDGPFNRHARPALASDWIHIARILVVAGAGRRPAQR